MSAANKRNIRLVQASAGSGKTYSIVTEIYDLIETGTALPEELIAVTFTRAAAGELRERVRERFFAAGRTELAYRMDNALIGTVDSVCQGLLERFSFEAGISPRVRNIPENMDTEAMNEALADAAALVENGKTLEALRRFGLDHGALISKVAALSTYARLFNIPGSALAPMAEISVNEYYQLTGKHRHGPDYIKNLRKLLEETINRLDAGIKSGKDTTKTTSNYLAALRDTRQALDNNIWNWNQVLKICKDKPGKDSQVDCAELAVLAEQHTLSSLFIEDAAMVIRAVYRVAADALEHYAAWKKERGLIDFTDMETLACALLDNPFAAETIRNEYRVLLVDEFQDTNPLQLAIFLKLEKLAGRAVWVGDRKQSIYAFRHADPMLMQDALDAADSADTVTLDTSYRSRPELVSFFNSLFVPVFAAAGLKSHEVTLKASRTLDKTLCPPLEVLRLPSKNKNTDREMTAGHIRNMLLSPQHYRVADRTTGKARDLRPGDLAVLVRNNETVQELAMELLAAGIPVSAQGAGAMLTREGQFILACLEYLLDSKSSLAALKAGLTADGGNVNKALNTILADPDKDEELLPRHAVLDTLDNIRQMENTASPSEMLSAIITQTGLYTLSRRWGGSRERGAVIDQVRTFTAQYEEACAFNGTSATLAGLYGYLDSLPGGGPIPAGEGTDAVTITTYHRSKGLEWPAVIACDLDKAERTGLSVTGPFLRPGTASSETDPLAGRSIGYWPWPYDDKVKKTPLYDTMKATPAEEHLAFIRAGEEIRLLYVGLTRTRDLLVLPLRSGDDCPAWLDRACGGELQVKHSEKDGGQEIRLTSETVVMGRVTTFNTISAGTAARPAGLWFKPPDVTETPGIPLYIPMSSCSLPAKARVKDVIELGARLNVQYQAAQDDPELGNLFHNFLAADSLELPDGKRLELAHTSVKARGFAGDIRPDELVTAGTRLWDFLQSRWPGARVFKEYPVRARIGATVYEGTADLVLETQDSLVLIDHKTWQGGPEHAAEYAGQLMGYIRALEEAAGKPCNWIGVHFPITGKIAELDVRPD